MTFETIENLFSAMRTWALVLETAANDPGDTGFDVRVSDGRVKHFVGVGDAAHWTKGRIKEWIGRVAKLHQELGGADGDRIPFLAGRARGAAETHQPNDDVSPATADSGSPDLSAGPPSPTADDLTAWSELDKAATPGPWFVDQAPRLVGSISATIDGLPRQVASADGQAGMFDRRHEPQVVLADNAAFIAASRTAVPSLLAEVRRLRDEVNDLRAAVLRVATIQIRRWDDAKIVHAFRQVATEWTEPFTFDRVQARIDAEEQALLTELQARSAEKAR